MGRWAWLSSSGRRKPARSRVSSRGTSRRSTSDPVLIVPNRTDVDRIERDLLRRTGALLAGSIGTFDDVFRELALGATDARAVTSDAQRAFVARRILTATPLNGLGRSARFAGFADALLATLSELESGLLEPEQLEGDLGLLVRRLSGGARPARPVGP